MRARSMTNLARLGRKERRKKWLRRLLSSRRDHASTELNFDFQLESRRSGYVVVIHAHGMIPNMVESERELLLCSMYNVSMASGRGEGQRRHGKITGLIFFHHRRLL